MALIGVVGVGDGEWGVESSAVFRGLRRSGFPVFFGMVSVLDEDASISRSK